MRFELSRLWPGNVQEPPRVTLAETQARIDAAPDESWIKVDTPCLANVQVPQVLTVNHDIKEMSRALSIYGHDLRCGKIRNIVIGPRCDKCRQSGIAYSHKGEVRILVCRRIENSMTGFFRERRAKLGCDNKDDPLPLGWLVFKGYPIESVECGRHLKMTLQMRYCWFD